MIDFTDYDLYRAVLMGQLIFLSLMIVGSVIGLLLVRRLSLFSFNRSKLVCAICGKRMKGRECSCGSHMSRFGG